MKWTRRITAVLLLLAIAVAGFYFGGNIPLADHRSLADALRTVAAFVFGVMGAWIGILHRDGLTKMFSHVKNAEAELARVRALFLPMKTAAVIIAYCLLAQAVTPILKQSSLAIRYRTELLGVNYGALLLMVMLQLWTLLLTLLPVDTVEESIDVKNEADQSVARRQGRVQRRAGTEDKLDSSP